MRHAKYRIEEGTLNNIYVHLKNKLYNIWWIRFYAKRVIFSNVPWFSQKSRQKCSNTCGATYLNTLHNPVGEFKGWHGGACDEGMGATLQAPHDAPIPLILFDGHPEQISHPLNYKHQTWHVTHQGQHFIHQGQHSSHQGHQCRPVSGIT